PPDSVDGGVPLDLLREEVGPGADLGVLLEQCAPLTLGHPAPDTEFNAVVQCIGAALQEDRAVAADGRGLTLRGPADEQLVRVDVLAPGLGHPFLAALPDDDLLGAEGVAGTRA